MKQENERTTKTVFKVIWAWEDEKEEKWLEQMARLGWHLKSVAPFFYEFHKGIPRQVTYRLDYKGTWDKDYPEYRAIFEESNWELVTTMSNWHYFRIETKNVMIPEIYNSNRAKSQKYRRLLAGLLPVLVIFVAVLNPALVRSSEQIEGCEGNLYTIGHIFFLVIMLFLIYAVIRVILKIRKLESESRE